MLSLYGSSLLDSKQVYRYFQQKALLIVCHLNRFTLYFKYGWVSLWKGDARDSFWWCAIERDDYCLCGLDVEDCYESRSKEYVVGRGGQDLGCSRQIET